MTNKEFLFIYDAALSNPNGDPDQENKPRMDRATKTNLVSDTRLKRTIRDYLISKFDGSELPTDVFVRMMGENKVSVETRLLGLVASIILDRNKMLEFIQKHNDLSKAFFRLKLIQEKSKKGKEDSDDKLKKVKSEAKPFSGDYFDLYHFYFKTDIDIDKAIKAKELGEVNNEIMLGIIKDYMIDIRFFGGAFAVGGFSRSIIGPIQVNNGYSFHPVELNSSNTIVTIMGDKEGQSGIGKKETLHYSLIGFTGTINSKRGEIVNLNDADLDLFRESIILSILNQRSDSKKNQYPRLYLEIDYKDNEIYGRLGDLRNLITVKSKISNEQGSIDSQDFTKVRSLNDIEIDITALITGIHKIKDRIQSIRVWNSLDESFGKIIQTLNKADLGEKLEIKTLDI